MAEKEGSEGASATRVPYDVTEEGRIFAWTRGVPFEDAARQQVAKA